MAFLQDIGLPTLGARDFSSAVSGFCQVFVVTRAKSVFLAASAYGQANTENFRSTREKPLVPRVWIAALGP